MVHLLIIKLNSKEIDGVPVTDTPVGPMTVLRGIVHSALGMMSTLIITDIHVL